MGKDLIKSTFQLTNIGFDIVRYILDDLFTDRKILQFLFLMKNGLLKLRVKRVTRVTTENLLTKFGWSLETKARKPTF